MIDHDTTPTPEEYLADLKVKRANTQNSELIKNYTQQIEWAEQNMVSSNMLTDRINNYTTQHQAKTKKWLKENTIEAVEAREAAKPKEEGMSWYDKFRLFVIGGMVVDELRRPKEPLDK